MKRRLLQGCFTALVCMSTACSDDSDDGGDSTTDGDAGRPPAGGGAGGAPAATPSETLLAICDESCVFDAVFSKTTCEPGDLIVAGELRRLGEGGAGGGPSEEPAGEVDPSCVDNCAQGILPHMPKCEGVFGALVDCLTENTWSCGEDGAWASEACLEPSAELNTCIAGESP